MKFYLISQKEKLCIYKKVNFLGWRKVVKIN